MKIIGLALLAGILAFAPATTSAAAASPDTARFDTAEVVLHSAAVYDGGQGSPNPFTDVALTADVTAPGGRTFTVDGFYDGDGAGGQSGDVFKVRVFADEAGTWTWATHSNVPSLDGRTGTFLCSGNLPGVFAKGPLVVDPQRPRGFRYREGGAVYLLSKFLDRAAPDPLKWSHTLFSELLTDADRQAFLDRHAGMKLNKMNVYLANQGDYSGVSTTPWLGTADANDKQRFDLARWHLYERWTLALRDAGFAAHLWFFADGSGFGDLPPADRKRLLAYGMARLSPYVNTLFTLMTEWQEGWTTAEVEDHMEFLTQHNPWDRLATVHGLPGDFSFPDAPWADFLDLQVALTSDHATVHAHTLRNRALAAKPPLAEEFGLGQEDMANRQKAWAAFTGGAAGSGTGAFLRPLAEFLAAIPFERMAPADELVLGGGAYALAEAGKDYVFYLYDGGTVQVDLGAAAGTFAARWFDPRTGAFQSAGAVGGGGPRDFTAPAAGDWVLHLSLQAPTPGSSFFTLTPCRLLDTRWPGAGPALASGEVRHVQAAGTCEIPAGAVALSLNVTAVASTGQGNIRFAPGGTPAPVTSTVNFAPGQTRANNAILALGGGGLDAVATVAGPGSVHLILDVNGYFE
jgi:hypothetical protein